MKEVPLPNVMEDDYKVVEGATIKAKVCLHTCIQLLEVLAEESTLKTSYCKTFVHVLNIGNCYDLLHPLIITHLTSDASSSFFFLYSHSSLIHWAMLTSLSPKRLIQLTGSARCEIRT